MSDRIDCAWCGRKSRVASEWEQLGRKDCYFRLCRTCANRRLRNPLNALLQMRRIEPKEAKA
jgi:hypothetical protein